jgi:hypothetical protein
MNKLEARRVQMLVRQREQLEEEMAALQAEVDALVFLFHPIRTFPGWLLNYSLRQELAAMNKKGT